MPTQDDFQTPLQHACMNGIQHVTGDTIKKVFTELAGTERGWTRKNPPPTKHAQLELLLSFFGNVWGLPEVEDQKKVLRQFYNIDPKPKGRRKKADAENQEEAPPSKSARKIQEHLDEIMGCEFNAEHEGADEVDDEVDDEIDDVLRLESQDDHQKDSAKRGRCDNDPTDSPAKKQRCDAESSDDEGRDLPSRPDAADMPPPVPSSDEEASADSKLVPSYVVDFPEDEYFPPPGHTWGGGKYVLTQSTPDCNTWHVHEGDIFRGSLKLTRPLHGRAHQSTRWTAVCEHCDYAHTGSYSSSMYDNPFFMARDWLTRGLGRHQNRANYRANSY